MSDIDEIYEKVIAGQADASYLMKQELTLLLKLSKRIKRNKDTKEGAKLKIAVLGSYSIQHFTMMLEAYLTGAGIDALIYEGEYDGIRLDILDDDSALYKFKPQMVLILMDHREIKTYPPCLTDEGAVEALAEDFVAQITALWERLYKNLPGCQIFQTDIVLPPERILGNLEGSLPYSRTGFIKSINRGLAEKAHSGVIIVGMEQIASYLGRRLWFDEASYFLSKAGYSPDALPYVCAAFTRLIAAARGRVYKCLVLDLDNTLWDGVVGDDGFDGINLNPHDAVGEAYRYFQSYVLELKKRGVILAVCSKNDEETAKEPFLKNPDMILKLSDIACFMANWDDKAGNIKKIAARLNIGTDSLVFIDDNPAEREIVRRYLPEVLVIDMPEDPSYYARAVDESDAFSWIELTKEDLSRAGTYAEDSKRAELQESFVDYDEYLMALDMRAKAGTPDKSRIKRFAQLINKSNQFNLRTKRYPEEELLSMLSDPSKKLIYVELCDKFSEYGLISCIILEKRDDICFIDTWLMSCRVLKRGVEYLACDMVVRAASEWGCAKLVGEYIPTKKNKMVERFYPGLGFKEAGDNTYELPLSDYSKKTFHIALEH